MEQLSALAFPVNEKDVTTNVSFLQGMFWCQIHSAVWHQQLGANELIGPFCLHHQITTIVEMAQCEKGPRNVHMKGGQEISKSNDKWPKGGHEGQTRAERATQLTTSTKFEWAEQ